MRWLDWLARRCLACCTLTHYCSHYQLRARPLLLLAVAGREIWRSQREKTTGNAPAFNLSCKCTRSLLVRLDFRLPDSGVCERSEREISKLSKLLMCSAGAFCSRNQDQGQGLKSSIKCTPEFPTGKFSWLHNNNNNIYSRWLKKFSFWLYALGKSLRTRLRTHETVTWFHLHFYNWFLSSARPPHAQLLFVLRNVWEYSSERIN